MGSQTIADHEKTLVSLLAEYRREADVRDSAKKTYDATFRAYSLSRDRCFVLESEIDRLKFTLMSGVEA